MIKYVLRDNYLKEDQNDLNQMNISATRQLRTIFPKQYSVLEENYKTLSALNDTTTKYIEFVKNENSKQFADKSVQTLYREESMLTDPFSPEEIESRNADQELLRIKHFKYGKELPPTMDELKYIEEMREKIAFERALPPLTDEASFELRRRLMEEQENKEWEKKENDKIRHQNDRMNLLENVLIEREKEIELEKERKLKALKSRKNEAKNQVIAKIHFRKQKILRKITKLQKAFNQIKNKRDITAEYSNYGSKVYANILREGITLERLSEKFKMNPAALSDYELYKEFLANLSSSYSTVDGSLDTFMKNSNRKLLKLEKQHIAQLEKADEEFHKVVDIKKSDNVNDKYNLNIQNVVPRVDTPYLESRPELKDYPHQEVNLDRGKFSIEEKRIEKIEAKNRVACLLQKLLRGRAVQNVMFDGKEKRLALIEELLIVANIQKISNEEENQIIVDYNQKKEKEAKILGLKGKLVSDTLEYVSKELLRITEEQRIREYVEEAREERYNREAVEMGKRQAEKKLKDREDTFFEEIMEVHKESVEDYLDDIFDFSSAFLCRKTAMRITEVKKDEYEGNWNRDNDDYGKIIKDFLECFLIPNIDKKKLRKRIIVVEKRFSHIVKEKQERPFK